VNNNLKKILISSFLVMTSVLLIGTIAYFRRTVNGNITGNTGNLVLIVNEANSELNETFTIPLNTNVEYVMPGERDVVYLDIDSTGSSGNVLIEIEIERTNLPDNLKFYLDKNLTEELTSMFFCIFKSDSMTKQIPIYWYWDAGIDSDNDSLFINKEVEATINVTARIIGNNFYEQLLSSATIDTNVDFTYSSLKFIESDQCYEYSNQCNENGEYCTEFEQQCFEENGQGLMQRENTKNDKYPILYYRGDVSNNNVIYANFCWLIVRTTETGGIKLIYNGEINEDGSCNNYSYAGFDLETGSYDENYDSELINQYINKTKYAFNEIAASPVYVGYMYNDTQEFSSYTTLYATEYIAHLANNTIDGETGRHTQNLKDSNAKSIIDAWYETNIQGKPEESLLEDTVWCNDRSVTDKTYSIENYETNGGFNYAASTRTFNCADAECYSYFSTPSLTCNRDVDKFTVEDANGNGDLNYPIGLLTVDEMIISGVTGTESIIPISYLTTNGYFWTLSPAAFVRTSIASAFMFTNFVDSEYADMTTLGLRPSISLKPGIKILSGDGSFEKPYQIY